MFIIKRPLYRLSILSCTVTAISLTFVFNACHKKDAPLVLPSNNFFNKSLVIAAEKIVPSTTAFENPVSKEMNEEWIDKTISSLKAFDVRDRFAGRLGNTIGVPIWNESLVFIGGDGHQTILTPLYTPAAKVNGVIISAFEKSGKFNAQILSASYAMKHLKDTGWSTHTVSKSTIKQLLSFFQTKSYDPVIQAVTNTQANMDFVYTVCWYVPVLVYAPSTVVFEKQCHQEIFWGTYSEFNYYYNNGDDFIESSEGYYETYDENTIEKGKENLWERLHIDTIAITNNPCLTRLVRSIMGNGTNDWAKMVKNFFTSSFGYPDLSQAHNVSFKVVFMGTDTGAVTHTGNYSYDSEISVNGNIFSGCSDLFAANTVIHEFTHALMQQMLSMHNIGDSIQRSNFDTCFNMYVTWLYSETTDYRFDGNIGNHEYMAGQLIDIMAAALAEFDNNTRDMEYYWCLSWAGLEGTKAWQYYSQHPMTSESQKNHSEYWQVPHWNWSYALTADRMAAINTIIFDEKLHRSGSQSPSHDWANCY